jgi:hypothetical protein
VGICRRRGSVFGTRTRRSQVDDVERLRQELDARCRPRRRPLRRRRARLSNCDQRPSYHAEAPPTPGPARSRGSRSTSSPRVDRRPPPPQLQPGSNGRRRRQRSDPGSAERRVARGGGWSCDGVAGRWAERGR